MIYSYKRNTIYGIRYTIFSSQSTGTNKLLKQGAALTTSAEDILETFNFITSPSIQNKKEIKFEDSVEKKIYDKLSFEPLYIDKIALQCKLDPSIVSAKLSLMELKGIARNVEGGRFIRNWFLINIKFAIPNRIPNNFEVELRNLRILMS